MRLGLFVALGLIFLPRLASADCTVDTDCPGTECGSQVCDWGSIPHTCKAASQSTGWCQTTATIVNADDSCKCKSLGATCVSLHCTFDEVPPDLAGADLWTPDLKPPPPDLFGLDLTTPPDLVTPPDLFGVDLAGQDLATPPAADMTAAPDLSVTLPADMASTSDMASQIQCDHDTECPDTACGGQVCRWHLDSQLCVAAGTDPQSEDGWCNKDDECKCHGQGATCNTATFHCTFTTPAGKPKAKGCAVGGDVATSAAFALFTLAALILARRLAPVRRRK